MTTAHQIPELNVADTLRFNSLMEETRRKVYNMAFRLSGSRADAEDLTQEAFFRAYRSFKDFEGDRPFENWIFRIVTRLYLDVLRSRRRRVSTVSYDAALPHEIGLDGVHFEVADSTPSPQQQMIDTAYSEDVEAALNSLSEDQRELIEMADIQQIPYQEIADKLGKPVGTIRSRLHRTHKVLRAEIEQRRRNEMSLKRPYRS